MKAIITRRVRVIAFALDILHNVYIFNIYISGSRQCDCFNTSRDLTGIALIVTRIGRNTESRGGNARRFSSISPCTRLVINDTP